MKTIFLIPLLLLSYAVKGQISSGNYEQGLNIAYNPDKKLITGFFENYTGTSRNFSCIFYLSGTLNGSSADIDTYYPREAAPEHIKGRIVIKNPQSFSIQLDEEHGGCWNVYHFKELSVFDIEQQQKWLEIRPLKAEKAYFHAAANPLTQLKTYVVKGDVVYIDRIEGQWMHCTYPGTKKTEGWVKRNAVE